MRKNGGRDIYTNKKGIHFALDTEKGTFEVVNKQGKHQGEINFMGDELKAPMRKAGTIDCKIMKTEIIL